MWDRKEQNLGTNVVTNLFPLILIFDSLEPSFRYITMLRFKLSVLILIKLKFSTVNNKFS